MTTTHINNDFLNNLAEVLEDDFPMIIESFIEHSTKILTSIPESLIHEDIKTFTLKIHSLKGSCRNVGAEHLAELCKEIEALVKNGQQDKVDPSLTEVREGFEVVSEMLLAYQQ